MQKKKVIALETGWKNRNLYLEGDIFEVNENESATWFKDLEENKPKVTRQKRSTSKKVSENESINAH